MRTGFPSAWAREARNSQDRPLHISSAIIVEHEVQLVNYLAATGKDIGLLINFGGRSLEFKKKFRKAKIEDVSLH